jgi:hypothetical protein
MNKAVWLAPKRVGQHAGVRHPCEDDDSCFRQFLSYSQYDFVTAQFRQKKVNNHQMRRSLSREGSCRKSRTGLAHHFILRETFQIAVPSLARVSSRGRNSQSARSPKTCWLTSGNISILENSGASRLMVPAGRRLDPVVNEGSVLTGRPERQRFAEFFFDCIFRCLLNPLIINPIKNVDFHNQTTILLLTVLNRLFS